MGKVIHWELCNKMKFDHTNKWYRHNSESILENETQTLLGFWDTNGSPNHGQTTRPYDNLQKKERTCRIVDFAIPVDHIVKLKENEKKDKYLDRKELKKLWNMKVTIIPIVFNALGTVTKGLVQGLEDLELTRRQEAIQTTALLRSARILRRVLETWELLSLKLQWETIS